MRHLQKLTRLRLITVPTPPPALPPLPVATILRRTGSNVSPITCPQVKCDKIRRNRSSVDQNRSSLILQVEEESFISNVDWFCYGCGDGRRLVEQQRQQPSPSSVSTTSAMELMQSAVKKVSRISNAPQPSVSPLKVWAPNSNKWRKSRQ